MEKLQLHDTTKLQIVAIIWVSQRENIYCCHTLTNKSCLMTMQESLCRRNFLCSLPGSEALERI